MQYLFNVCVVNLFFVKIKIIVLSGLSKVLSACGLEIVRFICDSTVPPVITISRLGTLVGLEAASSPSGYTNTAEISTPLSHTPHLSVSVPVRVCLSANLVGQASRTVDM